MIIGECYWKQTQIAFCKNQREKDNSEFTKLDANGRNSRAPERI